MSEIFNVNGYVSSLMRDDDDERDMLMAAIPNQEILESQMPSLIDYESEMSPIKDQGYLGSCVGFAVTALKEWQEQKEHLKEVEAGKHDHRKYYDLSEQWLYYKCKEIDPWRNSEGTSIRYAMKVLKNAGVPVEEGWSYNDLEPGKPEEWAKWVAKWNTIASYYRVNGLNELKSALTKSPIPIGVGIFQEFQYVSTSGIVQYPRATSKSLGGHAILACGFDDKRELIKFKNSWSTKWGQHGYGYLTYSYINNFMWDAWMAIDHSVTQEMYRN